MPGFDDELDLCDAQVVPAQCAVHGRHWCANPDGHDDPHECACGHRWTERES